MNPSKPRTQPVSRLRRPAVALTLATLVVVGATTADAGERSRSRSEANAGRLVGTWEFQVTFVDCETGAPLGPPFQSLHTYSAEGSVIEQGSRVGPPPTATRTVGQGIWEREMPGVFHATFSFFTFDANAQPLTRADIDETLEFEGRDRVLSYGTGTVSTPTGVVVATNCFVGPGDRLRFPASE